MLEKKDNRAFARHAEDTEPQPQHHLKKKKGVKEPWRGCNEMIFEMGLGKNKVVHFCDLAL